MGTNYYHRSGYRPVHQEEVKPDAPLTPRVISDTAKNINNTKYHAQAPRPWFYCWPLGNITTTIFDERVIHVFAKRVIPAEYTRLNYSAWLEGSSGKSSVTWRIYASKRRYSGPVSFDPLYFGGQYSTNSMTNNAASGYKSAFLDLSVGDINHPIYLTITAETTANPGGLGVQMKTFECWASVG